MAQTQTDDTAGMAPLDELVFRAGRMQADYERIIALCGEIAVGAGVLKAAAETGSIVPRRGGRRKKVNEVNPVNKVPSSGDDEKVRKEWWRKVECSLCGTQTGAIRKGDGVGTLFPCRHKDADGNACPGMARPARLVTE